MSAAKAVLERETFDFSREGEYFDRDELQKQTGQSAQRFASVVLKELVDNALDAAESVRVAPAIEVESYRADGLIRLAITDNGKGLAPEIIERTLNFSTRTSDKLAYRSPTRGAQGNALKTIIGIPLALGHKEPVTIRACGVETRIHTRVDPAGNVTVRPSISQVETNGGTIIKVELPDRGQKFDPVKWGRGFALFNPHASVKIRIFDEDGQHADGDVGEIEEFYQSSVAYPDEWSKFLPTDPTSPHWYDVAALKKLVFALIGVARRGGRDLTLRDFVQQFNGLKGTQKAKAVCDQLPWVSRLRDFEDREGDIMLLLSAMQEEARPVNPLQLGLVGEDHMRACFDYWYGVKRFWSPRKEVVEVDGVPFVFEVAVAETREPSSGPFIGLNFSPAYEDPFASTWFGVDDVERVQGFDSLLSSIYAHPDTHEWSKGYPCTAVAAHLVCPALDGFYKDRGKTRLELPREVAEAISGAAWKAAKELYREGKQRRRDATRADKQSEAREKPERITLKDAVFQVMQAAIEKTTSGGDYPVSKRDLYYDVRDRIQPLTPAELEYNYFSQDLLKQYEDAHGKIKGLYSESRGWLIHPHSGAITRLGTREVNGYQFPLWLYNKILYVEKQGFWEKLEHGKFAERYDMAIIMGQGYATEAVYTLLERADRDHKYQVFVLHDADPDGYQIVLKMREAAARIPNSNVNVADLGLTYDDAMALNLTPEKFTRKKSLFTDIELTPLALKAFTGVRVGEKKQWKDCLRVELNKLDVPTFIKYVDGKLIEHGATDKVIPPARELRSLVKDMYVAKVAKITDDIIAELLSSDEIAKGLTKKLRRKVGLRSAQEWIEKAFERERSISWREAVGREISREIWAQSDAIRDAVRAALEATDGLRTPGQ